MSHSTSMPLDQNGHRLLLRSDIETVEVEFNEYGPPRVSRVLTFCGTCDEPVRYEAIDGVLTTVKPCPLPEGITTVIRISVPSGRLVVADDLRPAFKVDIDAGADYNTTLGQAQVVEAYAALGCAYGPVGNNSLRLYRTGEDTFEIGTPPFEDDVEDDDEDDDEDEDDDTQDDVGPDGWVYEKDEEDVVVPGYPGAIGDPLAVISTSLWAYSIADYDLWVSRGGDTSPERMRDVTVVEVTPGTYEFTHHSGERTFDRDSPQGVTYAHVRRVDAP